VGYLGSGSGAGPPVVGDPLRGYCDTMQSFLPYPDDARSAAVLDNRRLGKQRVKCLRAFAPSD